MVKIRQDKQVINKSIYLALGVNLEGHKELLGMWLSENEGAKFWLGILTELQNKSSCGVAKEANGRTIDDDKDDTVWKEGDE